MAITFPPNLMNLVNTIQVNSYTQPNVAIEAARKLFKSCQTDVHIAYVYEQLGFAHLVLGEHRMAIAFYEQANRLSPENFYVLANLAHALYEVGNHEAAVTHGRLAMHLKDSQVCANTQIVSTSIDSGFLGKKNLVSFSLFGNLPRYCEMAVLNVLSIKRHLPEFVCRFYIDHSVPGAIIARLKQLGSEIVFVDHLKDQMPPTFWRFLAIDDPGTDRIVVRDVDALFDARDAWCVKNWIQSDFPFHIIRDDCCHTELILAGLFSIRAGTIRDIKSKIQSFIDSKGSESYERFADQLFLRHYLWPVLKANALTHDSVYKFGYNVREIQYQPNPLEGPHNKFVGANFTTRQVNLELDSDTNSKISELHLTVKGANNTVICQYPLLKVQKPCQWSVSLPDCYIAAIEAGNWTCNVTQNHCDIGAGSVSSELLTNF